MRKNNKNANTVIALAYLHRYGILSVVLFAGILPQFRYLIFAIGCILYAIWSFVGYKCRWKHIFCSYQNAYRKKMTPNKIRWDWVKKSDAYGVPIVFFVLGLLCVVVCCLFGLGK